MNSDANNPVVAEAPAEGDETQAPVKKVRAKKAGPWELPADTARNLASLLEQLGTAGEELTDAVQGWNDLVEQIETLRDEQVEQWQEKFQDRSERWQEGETGQAVEAMIETWENLDFSTVEDPDVETLPSELEDLPQEPE